jgi:hypothetical protein
MTNRQTDRPTQTQRQTDTDRQADRQAAEDRQTDETDRLPDRPTNRQIARHT